jgi:hypothetical protein
MKDDADAYAGKSESSSRRSSERPKIDILAVRKAKFPFIFFPLI